MRAEVRRRDEDLQNKLKEFKQMAEEHDRLRREIEANKRKNFETSTGYDEEVQRLRQQLKETQSRSAASEVEKVRLLSLFLSLCLLSSFLSLLLVCFVSPLLFFILLCLNLNPSTTTNKPTTTTKKYLLHH